VPGTEAFFYVLGIKGVRREPARLSRERCGPIKVPF
jgi:hypothetical protein